MTADLNKPLRDELVEFGDNNPGPNRRACEPQPNGLVHGEPGRPEGA